MMAKMFYTMDETRAALGKSDEEVKQLAREGRLREFRDGPRLMFKADQVEALKAELSGAPIADRVDLGADSAAPIGIGDTGTGAGISLSDTDFGQSPAAPGAKEDTALAGDVGLSGSVGGIPSPARDAGGSLGGSGINIFRDDEVEAADPMAQTAISSGLQSQVNLEGVGSGSGLLDLTRESDDTSLGVVLDEISAPGGAEGSDITFGGDAAIEAMEEPRGGVLRTGAPIYVEAPDPSAPAFGAMALAAVVLLLVSAFVLISSVVGVTPDLVETVVGPAGQRRSIWVLFGIGAILAVIFAVVGLLIGKSGRR